MTGKDRRLYGRFTLDFADSPKIAPLSDAAFRTLVEMTLHSRRMLDDGFVDARIAARKWKKKAIAELLSNDAVNPSLSEVDGGYRIHDFDEHQQTRADIEAKRSAGSKGGRASAQARASADGEADAEAHLKLITETETEASTSKEVVKRKRRTQVSPNFKITDAMRAWGKEHTPLVDLDSKLAEFISYWRGVGTPMADWEQTWRNGMLKQQSFAERDQAKSAPPKSLKVPKNDEWMYR